MVLMETEISAGGTRQQVGATWEGTTTRSILWSEIWTIPHARNSFLIRATYNTMPGSQTFTGGSAMRKAVPFVMPSIFLDAIKGGIPIVGIAINCSVWPDGLVCLSKAVSIKPLLMGSFLLRGKSLAYNSVLFAMAFPFNAVHHF